MLIWASFVRRLPSPRPPFAELTSLASVPEFAYVLGLDSTASSIVTTVNPQPESCAPTGTTAAVKALILAAVKNLKTNLTLESVVRLDDYQTPLNFVQSNVPTVLADDVFNLVGAIGKTSECPLFFRLRRRADFLSFPSQSSATSSTSQSSRSRVEKLPTSPTMALPSP